MTGFFGSALLVGAGGFVGSVLRYGLGSLIQRTLGFPAFPYGTLVVNLSGCLAIGLLAGFIEARQLASAELRAFAMVGVLGGFTTFSTFGFDTFALLREGDLVRSIANVLLQVVLGVLCVWLGYSIMSPR